jgi:hypothetical protein
VKSLIMVSNHCTIVALFKGQHSFSLDAHDNIPHSSMGIVRCGMDQGEPEGDDSELLQNSLRSEWETLTDNIAQSE